MRIAVLVAGIAAGWAALLSGAAGSWWWWLPAVLWAALLAAVFILEGGYVMIKRTRQGPEYTTYTFSVQEFKDLLGIGDDPAGVLLVQADFSARTITVTMSPP
jgi:hypothetical protein